MTGKKVMLGMSGGVDSSVAAALLLDKGYEVIGVTLKIWSDDETELKNTSEGCCSLYAVDDARKVANTLNIPYYVLNFKDIFQEKVIDYFKYEYLRGRTPNPCIACNKHIKFHAMLDKAVSMGFDYIATGHYARIEYDKDKNRYLLKKSITAQKDQTYALYSMTQQQLAKTLMPVGDYEKGRIREIAKQLGLSVSSKPDSQEICFIEDNNYSKFICENTTEEINPGNFVDTKGNILGRHKGIVHYTVGQRKGLGMAFGKPMYVVSIDVEENKVVLGDENEVFSDYLIASDVNLISIEQLNSELRVKAKIRYSSKESDAVIYPLSNNRVKVVFDEPQRAVTPGQSVVFYDNYTIVGGGVILL